MSQPVKLSDALITDARFAGELNARSIAGQVEFWARLGKSVEMLLPGKQQMMLSRSALARPLSEYVETISTEEGRQRLAAVLESEPFPHYEPHPDMPGILVRIEADGKRTVGRFVNRQFRSVKVKAKR